MATNFRSTARTLIYNTLNGAISGLAVYDHVPFEPEGAPTNEFPYATIGDAEAEPWDTDDTLGAEVETTIHVYTRYKGRKQVDETLDAIYGLLHRASLAPTGHRVVDCLFTFSDVFVEQDGITRHGLIRFRLTIEEA